MSERYLKRRVNTVRKAPSRSLLCDHCADRQRCLRKAEFAREQFFSGQKLGCSEYEPEWYRGIEGCLA